MTCAHLNTYAFGRPSDCAICLKDEIMELEEQIKKLQRKRIELIHRLGEDLKD